VCCCVLSCRCFVVGCGVFLWCLSGICCSSWLICVLVVIVCSCR